MKSVKNSISLLIIAIALASFSQTAKAHCEVPCGIYNDSARILIMYEDITTIEKAINQINELSSASEVNYNQIVRWVMTKEEHAKKLQETASQYFLHQRIKIKDPSEEEAYAHYIKQLTLMHKVMVYAMKAKQNTDLKYIGLLRSSLHEFEHAYFGNH